MNSKDRDYDFTPPLQISPIPNLVQVERPAATFPAVHAEVSARVVLRKGREAVLWSENRIQVWAPKTKSRLSTRSRVTHYLRASRQTELERTNPTHVVCAIMGNTPAVAHRHYLQTSDDDLLRAAGRSAEKAAQNPAQYTTESGRMGSQTGFQPPDRGSFEPSTVPRDTTQCEGERKSGENRSAGVDGNRTHQTSFQRSHRV